MLLTSSSTALLYSTLSNSVAPPAAALENLFNSVIADASYAARGLPPIKTIAEWGIGQVSLSFRLQNSMLGDESIPWSLVQLLAEKFLRRTQLGLPAAFRATVNGQFGSVGGNGMRWEPWVEVVLTVGGRVVTDGIEWGIF